MGFQKIVLRYPNNSDRLFNHQSPGALRADAVKTCSSWSKIAIVSWSRSLQSARKQDFQQGTTYKKQTSQVIYLSSLESNSVKIYKGTETDRNSEKQRDRNGQK